MRKLIVLSILLTGCATVGQRQSECEVQHQAFEDIYLCTKLAMASDPRTKNSAAYKLYMLKGEQLSQQIREQQISEIDAKVEWQKLYLELKGLDDKHAAAAFERYNATRSRTTTCTPVGNSVTCNTN